MACSIKTLFGSSGRGCWESQGRQRGSIKFASRPGSKDWFTWLSKRLPGASVHLSTTIFLPSWFAKANDNSITTAEHSTDRISLVGPMRTQSPLSHHEANQSIFVCLFDFVEHSTSLRFHNSGTSHCPESSPCGS